MLAQWPLARPLKRVLRGHRGSWLPLLGMRRQERLVFDVGSAPSLSPASSVSPSPPRGGLCSQRHLGGGPRQPRGPRGDLAPHGGVGAPARPPGQLGMERRLTPGFPASDPLGSAQGETRGARVTCPGPCVAGPRTAAGGWLGCQHPEHCVRDTGSPGPLASAVAAGDAGGRGPQTHGPGPGVRDDGLECVVASDFRKGSDPFPRSGVRSPWLLVPKLPRAPRGPAALVVFASLPKRGPWDGGLREASARPRGGLGVTGVVFSEGKQSCGRTPLYFRPSGPGTWDDLRGRSLRGGAACRGGPEGMGGRCFEPAPLRLKQCSWLAGDFCPEAGGRGLLTPPNSPLGPGLLFLADSPLLPRLCFLLRGC